MIMDWSYTTGLQLNMMNSKATRFVTVMRLATAQSAYTYPRFGPATRAIINEMLSLIGMIEMQKKNCNKKTHKRPCVCCAELSWYSCMPTPLNGPTRQATVKPRKGIYDLCELWGWYER